MRKRRRRSLRTQRTQSAPAEVLEARTLLTAVFDAASNHLEVTLNGGEDVKVTSSVEGLVLLNEDTVDQGNGLSLIHISEPTRLR